MTKKLIWIYLLFIGFNLFSEEAIAISPSKLEDWAGRKVGKKILEKNLLLKDGVLASSADQLLYVLTAASLPIEATGTYLFEGKLSLPEATKKSKVYFGVACYDASDRMIQGANAKPVEGSESVLLADAPAGSRQLLVEDSSKWLRRSGSVVAFNCLENYSDLPNFDLSPSVTHIEKEDKGWTVTLRSPLRKTFAAGNKIRQQVGASYIYITADRKQELGWTIYSKTFQGIGVVNAGKADMTLPPGTVKAKIVVFSTGEPTEIQIKDVLLKQITQGKP